MQVNGLTVIRRALAAGVLPLIGILVLTSTSQTTALASENFKGWIAEHTAFKSCLNAERVRIESALFMGLSAMQKINPSLLQDRMLLNQRRQALFNCELYATSLHGMTSEISQNAPTGDQELLPVGTIFVGNLLKEDLSQSPSVDKLIRHEFLHFLQFDNLPPEIHNAKTLVGPNFRYDVVYECSGAIENVIYGDGIDPESFCVFAKIINGKPDVSSDSYSFLSKSKRPFSISCAIRKTKSKDDIADWRPAVFKACAL